MTKGQFFAQISIIRRRILVLASVIVLGAGLAACESTVEGAGDDIEEIGDEIEEATD